VSEGRRRDGGELEEKLDGRIGESRVAAGEGGKLVALQTVGLIEFEAMLDATRPKEESKSHFVFA
jgi:hypothetical protein